MEELCQDPDNSKVDTWLNSQGDQGGAALLHYAAANGHVEVAKILVEKEGVVVNMKDHESGDTPLHVAARNGHHGIVLMLVKAGWSLGIPNKQGETPMELLGNIAASYVEEILDSCIVGEREGDKFLMTITYPFLSYQQDYPQDLVSVASTKTSQDTTEGPEKTTNIETQVCPETTSILFLTRSKDHLHLLEHPVITTFLYMKWKSIEQFYYFKFLFVALFAAVLNAYIFLFNDEFFKFVDLAEKTDRARLVSYGQTVALWWITLALLVLFSLRELAAWPPLIRQSMKNLNSSKGVISSLHRMAEPLLSYLKLPENSLRLMLIVSTYLLLFLPQNNKQVQDWADITNSSTEETKEALKQTLRQELSAITILLSWVYGLFFTANFPGIAIYATMFTTISKNFFKILLWLFWFVFAFSLTFFFLFHSTAQDDEGNPINPSFGSVKESIVKTIVMVFTGELDFGGIEFSSSFGKFIFLLFVFFIMLVLMNLLNGLAISDIGIIQKESEINTQIARMKIICNYESLCINSTALQKYGGFALVSQKLQGSLAKFEFNSEEQTWQSLNSAQAPKDMLENAKGLVVNKSLDDAEPPEAADMRDLMDRMKRMEKTLEKISEKLNQIS